MNPQTVGSVVWLLGLAALMYFLVIRPQQQQQKRRNEMISALKAGDKIVTLGGVIGSISEIRDESLTLRIADKVEVQLMKSGVGYVLRNE